MSELATLPQPDLSVVEMQPWESQRDLVKRTVAKDCTDQELDFFYQARRLRLDPLARQICIVVRHGTKGRSATVQVQIDGFRAKAEETGRYAGSDLPIFTQKEGGLLESASVTVYKMVEGHRCAFSAIAYWDEYFPGDKAGAMWRKMPHVMLAKCAEAQALRKGFPAQLSGIYIPEEMDQAGGQSDVIDLDPQTGDPVVPISQDDQAQPIKGYVVFLRDCGASANDRSAFEKICRDNGFKAPEVCRDAQLAGHRDLGALVLFVKALIEGARKAS